MSTSENKQIAAETSRSVKRVHAFVAVKKRRQASVNVWFFDSPKNKARLTIRGNLKFMSAVLMEGDRSVERYDVEPIEIGGVIGGKTVAVTPGMLIHLTDQNTVWWEASYSDRKNAHAAGDLERRRALASQQKLKFQIQSAKELESKAILFDNWLDLCSAISRCRNISCDREIDLLHNAVSSGPTTVGTVLNFHGVDKACMYSAVANLLQKSIITTDLENRLLGLDSILSRMCDE